LIDASRRVRDAVLADFKIGPQGNHVARHGGFLGREPERRRKHPHGAIPSSNSIAINWRDRFAAR
jgi:hypothetical protein